MSELSRRVFLGTASLAAGAAGLRRGRRRRARRTKDARRARKSCRPSGSPWSKTRDMSPTEARRRQATVKELPVSKGLAGVSMRLNPGGIRELHWHAIAAEWAFVSRGGFAPRSSGPMATSEINDFDAGDVWYFPRGHGHMLQGLGPGETHFVLIFDDGAFSEFGTFSSTDWLGHTPPEVLSKITRPSRFGLREVSQERAVYRSGPDSTS